MTELSSIGEWSSFNERWTEDDLRELARELNLSIPVELAKLLTTLGGGHLVLEEPDDELAEAPWEYCPQFKLFGVDRIKSWWTSNVARYMPDCIPIGSDSASTLFVWRHTGTDNGEIFAVPMGDLGWESARTSGKGIEEMLTRWAAIRDQHKNQARDT